MQAQPSHIARTSDFFNECDVDRDGLISFDELCTVGIPRFVADPESAYRKSLKSWLFYLAFQITVLVRHQLLNV